MNRFAAAAESAEGTFIQSPRRPSFPGPTSQPHRTNSVPSRLSKSRHPVYGVLCRAQGPRLMSLRRFRFCDICGTGVGTIPCGECHATGSTNTKPGGAGVQFFVGTARCKTCHGQCMVPCPICCGYEARSAPPDPDRSAVEVFDDDSDEDDPGEMSFNDILEMFR